MVFFLVIPIDKPPKLWNAVEERDLLFYFSAMKKALVGRMDTPPPGYGPLPVKTLRFVTDEKGVTREDDALVYFDDCPICAAVKRADEEGRDITFQELMTAYELSEMEKDGGNVEANSILSSTMFE